MAELSHTKMGSDRNSLYKVLQVIRSSGFRNKVGVSSDKSPYICQMVLVLGVVQVAPANDWIRT
jgi:hypothetical protein